MKLYNNIRDWIVVRLGFSLAKNGRAERSEARASPSHFSKIKGTNDLSFLGILVGGRGDVHRACNGRRAVHQMLLNSHAD